MDGVFPTYTVTVQLKLVLTLGVLYVVFSNTIKQLSDTSWVSYDSARFQQQRFCQIPQVRGSVPQKCPHFRRQCEVPLLCAADRLAGSRGTRDPCSGSIDSSQSLGSCSLGHRLITEDIK